MVLKSRMMCSKKEKDNISWLMFDYYLELSTEENSCGFFIWAKYKCSKERPMSSAFPRTRFLAVMPLNGSHKLPLSAKKLLDVGACFHVCGIALVLDLWAILCTAGSWVFCRACVSRITLTNYFARIKRWGVGSTRETVITVIWIPIWKVL